jgi:hypothetical protein
MWPQSSSQPASDHQKIWRIAGNRPALAQPSSGRGPVPLVVTLLTVTTGIAVLLVAVMLPDLQPLPRDDLTMVANRAAAEEFYAAQDAALTTGDGRRLIAALAPAFRDYQPGALAGRDRAALVAQVTALRGIRPGVRLTAEPLFVDGDRVLVYVSLSPAESGNHAGAGANPLAASLDTLELVRVTGGVVSERWSLEGVPGTWPASIVTPTAVPIWSASRFATATAAGQVCGASHCS